MTYHDTLASTRVPRSSGTSILTLMMVTLCVGVAAGIAGMLLALLLHFIQHVAYGYSLYSLRSAQSFLQGVTVSTPARRVTVLAICGGIAGFGWWAVYRFGRPLLSISKAVKSDSPFMPVLTTLAHALLQIVTVALGSPLGREVAPREVGSAMAGCLSRRCGLSVPESQLMVACGAGAGLAAVYNVPLGGAMFVLEVLLGTFNPAMAIPALVTSVTATVVAWLGLGNEPQYVIPALSISYSLVCWSIFVGPVLGFLAYWFSRLTGNLRSRAPRGMRLIVSCIVVFVFIGLVAIPFPQLLGNGKGPIQLGINDAVNIPLATTLLLLKLVVIVGSLWAGAQGGLLTPGMTIGAMVSIIIGGFWNMAFPAVPMGAFVIVGAAAFLAASMRMPLTAVVLASEFTRVNHDYLVPILLAVSGSSAVLSLCIVFFETRPEVRAANQQLSQDPSIVP